MDEEEASVAEERERQIEATKKTPAANAKRRLRLPHYHYYYYHHHHHHHLPASASSRRAGSRAVASSRTRARLFPGNFAFHFRPFKTKNEGEKKNATATSEIDTSPARELLIEGLFSFTFNAARFRTPP